MSCKVPLEKLRYRCKPAVFRCADSRGAKPLQTILGQKRALKALDFGLRIRNKGFNIYVSGLAGSGRKTALRRYLKDLAKDQPTPPDWCYVNNFKDPYRPNAISMPAGMAREFSHDVDEFVKAARKGVVKVFESVEYANRRSNTSKKFQEQRDELFNRINEEARRNDLLIQATPMGLLAIPVMDNRPMNEDEFRALDKKTQMSFSRRQARLQEKIKKAGRQLAVLEKKTAEMIAKLDQDVASYTLENLMEDLTEKYSDQPGIISHLRTMQKDMVENIAMFRGEDLKKEGQAEAAFVVDGELKFRKYKINVIVDNSELKGAPIIIEMNPTYNSLFGRIEKEAQFGALLTDFTMVRAGSLHHANGGYLILPAEDVLINIFSWDSLKRAIRNRDIRIEEAYERLGFMVTRSIMPGPIPWDIKVILIGTPYLYYRLFELDDDFKDLFKVKADFDNVMELNDMNIRSYASFLCNLCEVENLTHFDSKAIAKVVEHSCRLASDQEKLSTRFGEIANVIREASFYASQEDAGLVQARHVHQAVEEHFLRSNLLMEKTREMIAQGVIKIDVHGEKTGQLNGLSVIDLGDIMFGRPSKITSSIEPGHDGLIDIEREAKLGGPIHTKGVLILSGYIAHTYANDKPISLTARIVFEQSYSGIEGDSASSAELYAILSALSGKPIRQGIAVTGSVNQKGEIQAIGGVNEKIEGFFEVCKALGFTGGQGVIIPRSNVRNLMLKDEVIDAVREGRFSIYSVATIDEGIEILTGIKAGIRLKSNRFEPGSIHYLVDRELRRLGETWLTYSDGTSKGSPSPHKKKDSKNHSRGK